jgi:hypothetical protein
MREFQRPGHRIGLAGTVIAFAIAAFTTLGAGAASSHATDTPRVIRFSGHGFKVLPQFRVGVPSTMVWTNSGSYFEISCAGEGAVTSDDYRGMTYIPPGPYDKLRVRAIGDWTITIRTGVEAVGTPITFSGSGGRALPPFRLRNSKTMHWTNTGTRFQSFPDGPAIKGFVSSSGHSGKIGLPAGRYRLYISAVEPEQPMGTWKIIIR